MTFPQAVDTKTTENDSSDDEPRFKSFPDLTLLEAANIPIAEIAGLALREGQSSNPIYRVHRWFARRLGSQFRAILTGLSLKPNEIDQFWETFLGCVPLDGAVVLDPFIGGGTSLIEAGRCGAKVIGFDIDPVATFITRFELEAATFDPSVPEITKICAEVSAQLAPFHKTKVPGVGDKEVLHHFWVELRTCHKCGVKFEIHPHFQLAYSREKKAQWVFCKTCHDISKLPIHRRVFQCECGTKTWIKKGPLNQGKVRCPECRAETSIGDRGHSPERPEWRLFAQEYIQKSPKGYDRLFKKANEEDHTVYDQAGDYLRKIENKAGFHAPCRTIPKAGRSDGRPILHGFIKYRDLFNDRQLLHLTLLGRAIEAVDSEQSRRFLGMAFSDHLTTNCMYAGYAFGYRRISPMFSIHSYRHITRPVEINPWLDGIGRGTFPNVVRKIGKAVAFSKNPSELDPKGNRKASQQLNITALKVSMVPSDVIVGSSRAAVITQSSEDLHGIPDGSIDLILTDPPYFDNLNYSELSDFYLAWHQSLGMTEPPYNNLSLSAPIDANLALSNRSERSVVAYQECLGNIFKECYRVLKANGIFVFTYHHKAVSAWVSIGEVMARSGLVCTSVLPLRGEGRGGLHSYKGTIKWDAVFVCRKRRTKESETEGMVVVTPEDIDSSNKRAGQFNDQLGGEEKIGFREPDHLNLCRALIVSYSKVVTRKGLGVPLKKALEKIKIQGGNCNAQTR